MQILRNTIECVPLLSWTRRSALNCQLLVTQEQILFSDAEEWEDFFSILREDLPTTFRVTGSRASVGSNPRNRP